MLGAVSLFAVAVVVFGTATRITDALGVTRVRLGHLSIYGDFVLSLAALAVAGAADMVSVYVRSSLIQLHTPDAMRGRVAAVSQLTISASNELGEAETGLMASLLGPVGAVAFGGVAALGIVLLWARLFPELRRARTFDPPVDLAPELGVTQP